MASGISGFFKGLFGGGGNRDSGESGGEAPTVGEAVEYEGFLLYAAPEKRGGQWLTAGRITKEIDGTIKEHRFIRADTSSTRDDAAELSLFKAKRIVDEQGDKMFEPKPTKS